MSRLTPDRVAARLWRAAALLIALASIVLSGCTSFASFNEPLQGNDGPQPTRARFGVDGHRGNPKALVWLSLSGGGSRSAYLATATLNRLASVDPEFDFLAEVDVISSVSGGSLAGAYYVATRDDRITAPALAARVRMAVAEEERPPLTLDADGSLRCAAAPAAERDALRERLKGRLSAPEVRRLTDLCLQATLEHLRIWTADSSRSRMRRNYLMRWLGNSLWPTNIAKYWFTAYDRSDIMAQTLADNLFDTPVLGRDLKIGELNPTRPYLLVNATNASNQARPDGRDDDFPFGSVFSFTEEEFATRLRSDISSFPLARAVMASSAFPLVFANMTLREFGPEVPEGDRWYLHLFDGGNSDNLGLRTVKRTLLTLHAQGRLDEYDRIVVIAVDAFTRPPGARRDQADPRGLLGLFIDTNLTDAVDSLLLHNRINVIEEFVAGEINWSNGECDNASRLLPPALCRQLDALHGVRTPDQQKLALGDRLVFYHFGFDDVSNLGGAEALELKRRLDDIPTSFMISADNAAVIDRAVDLVLSPRNECLSSLRHLLTIEAARAADVNDTQRACMRQEGHPTRTNAPRGKR